MILSDFFDFSIYLDASTSDIAAWYLDRFRLLQRTVFQQPTSYFHHYRDLGPAETMRGWTADLVVDQRSKPQGEHPANA